MAIPKEQEAFGDKIKTTPFKISDFELDTSTYIETSLEAVKILIHESYPKTVVLNMPKDFKGLPYLTLCNDPMTSDGKETFVYHITNSLEEVLCDDPRSWLP